MSPPTRGGPGGGPRTVAAALIAALSALAPPPAAGQTQNSWKAANAANNNWSTAANWTGGVIANGQIAVFSTAAARVYDTNNDLTNLNLAGITVNGNNTAANPLTIGGNALTVSASGINMSAATADLTVSTSSLTVGAAQTWTVATGRTLTVTALLLGSQPLTVAGGGTVAMNNLGTAGSLAATGGTVSFGAGSFFIPGGTVVMNNTSTLSGVGTVVPNTGSTAGNRVTIASGATLAPGLGGVGTLAVGANFAHATAELDGGATFAADLGSAVARPAAGIADVNANDRLNVTGVLQFATTTSNLKLAVSGAGQTFNLGKTYDYVLATGSDGVAGFDPTRITILPSNFVLAGNFAVQSWNNSLLLSYTPTPEAGDAVLACAAAAGVVGWVRFWRRRWLGQYAPAARSHDAVRATP